MLNETGWRTFIIDSKSELLCSDGNLVVKNETVKTIPIAELKTVLVNSLTTTITVSVLNELSKNNVKLIFCDERHNPNCELCGYTSHTESAGRLIDQANWSDINKRTVWKNIISQKIKNQCELLKYLQIEYPQKLDEYMHTVTDNDETNREGQAARMYFNRLFGMSFVRHAFDNTNSALNYGYTILLSSINRIIGLYGYNTEIGIKHCNRSNRFNLSCDIMEPFRPFVDLIVYRNMNRELDWDFKKSLISIPYMSVIYEGTETKLQYAMEDYTLKVLKAVGEKECNSSGFNYLKNMIFLEKEKRLVG